MVSYKVAVSIYPSHFSNIERKLIWFYKRNLTAEGSSKGLRCLHGKLCTLNNQ